MAIPNSSLHTELQPTRWHASEGGSNLKWSMRKRATFFSTSLVLSPVISVAGGVILSSLIFTYVNNPTDDQIERRFRLKWIKHMAKCTIPLYNAYYMTRSLEKDDIADDEDADHPYPNGENIGDQLE